MFMHEQFMIISSVHAFNFMIVILWPIIQSFILCELSSILLAFVVLRHFPMPIYDVYKMLSWIAFCSILLLNILSIFQPLEVIVAYLV